MLSPAAQKVVDIAKLLRRDAERLVALRCFVLTGNEGPVVTDLGQHEEGHAATLVRGAAIEAMVLACARASDTPGSHRYSIYAAERLLREEATLREVARDEASLRAFLGIAKVLPEVKPLLRVRDFRDKVVAHHLPDQERDEAYHNDVEDAVDSVLEAVYALGAGVGIATVSFDAVTEMWAARSRCFWSALLGGAQDKAQKQT